MPLSYLLNYPPNDDLALFSGRLHYCSWVGKAFLFSASRKQFKYSRPVSRAPTSIERPQEGRDFQREVSSPSQEASKQSVRPDEGFPIQMGGRGVEGGLKTSVFLSVLKVGAPMTYRTKCFIYL